MAKSRYQSANKELGEMYEHELVQTAEELDATMDELIAQSNALMSTNDALTAERDELQRRLGEIAKHAAAPNWGDIVCAGGKLELATTRLDEICAIAEGRTE